MISTDILKPNSSQKLQFVKLSVPALQSEFVREPHLYLETYCCWRWGVLLNGYHCPSLASYLLCNASSVHWTLPWSNLFFLLSLPLPSLPTSSQLPGVLFHFDFVFSLFWCGEAYRRVLEHQDHHEHAIGSGILTEPCSLLFLVLHCLLN